MREISLISCLLCTSHLGSILKPRHVPDRKLNRWSLSTWIDAQPLCHTSWVNVISFLDSCHTSGELCIFFCILLLACLSWFCGGWWHYFCRRPSTWCWHKWDTKVVVLGAAYLLTNCTSISAFLDQILPSFTKRCPAGLCGLSTWWTSW